MTEQAKKASVKKGDVVIALVDEWNDGRKMAFDGHVQQVREDGVELLYLSGHRSRNDFVPWADVVARVDRGKPRITLGDTGFVGHFDTFGSHLTT